MKTIQLTKGARAIVDNEDYDYLSQFHWHLHNQGYATRSHVYYRDGKKVNSKIYMHRDITTVQQGYDIDHVNHNKLDNRRCNLRICTRSQNMLNSKKHKDAMSSKFKGIYYEKRRKHFVVRIRLNGRTEYIGSFQSETVAALAYNQAVQTYHQEFALLNKIAA